jgi:hypothetical protein
MKKMINVFNILSVCLIILTIAFSLRGLNSLTEKIAVLTYVIFTIDVIVLVMRHMFTK